MNNRQKLVQQEFLNNEKAVIKRLNQVYNKSLTDINDKVKNLEFKIGELQEKYDWLDPDDPARAKIKSQIQSKIYQKNYQEQLQKQIDGVLKQMQSSEYLTVSDYLDGCYTDGFIGTVFDLHGQGVPLMMPIDQEAMVRAVQLESKISKGLYNRLGEDVGLLKKKITAQVSRSIATGESFSQMAKQLTNYTRIGYNNAIRIARTEGHRIQTTATMDAAYEAKKKGADLVKQWDATLDGATRESHVAVDQEIRELDEKFSNGLMYPGDPAGGAAEVINCRCALLQRARWAVGGSFTKFDRESGEIKEFAGIDDYNEFKKKYLKATKDLTNNGNGDIIDLKKSIPIDNTNTNVVNGQDLSGQINYTDSGFEFDIQTVVHAQGFDGVPQVVEYDEFKQAMEKSNFYAERTYGAPTQDVLDEWQKQLYEGEWYIDCSTGGAQYGQGMYCAACYDLTDHKSLGGIGWEMSHYQSLAAKRGNPYCVTEALTLQPNAKIFDLPYGVKAQEYIADAYRNNYMRTHATTDQLKTVEKLIEVTGKINKLTYKESTDFIDALYAERNQCFELIADLSQAATKAMQYYPTSSSKFAKMKNAGTLVAEMGYDAINAIGHGQSGSYTVILNRTKVIFCKGGSIYGN